MFDSFLPYVSPVFPQAIPHPLQLLLFQDSCPVCSVPPCVILGLSLLQPVQRSDLRFLTPAFGSSRSNWFGGSNPDPVAYLPTHFAYRDLRFVCQTVSPRGCSLSLWFLQQRRIKVYKHTVNCIFHLSPGQHNCIFLRKGCVNVKRWKILPENCSSWNCLMENW